MAMTALDGASTYLNNLLLARGFLKDAKPIDFTRLAGDDTTFDRNATTAQLINLIHDLILRRDRDAEQREELISTIHNLRAEETQRVLDLQKLQDKNIQIRSDLATSEAQQRALTQSLKRSQAESKELREQLSKAKSTIDQTRAKAISDVRKRDLELDKLRNHLSGVTRGKKVTDDGSVKMGRKRVQDSESRPVRVEDDTCLQNESNELLTALVNETSIENVALRKIVEDSLKYLRSLTGMEEDLPKEEIKPEKAIGIPGQYRDRSAASAGESIKTDALVPVQELATSMSQVLSHCLSILRDPSFVPIEEVQIRDHEIAKLKAGWEKMADRWKEAVIMMGQLRQRMAHLQGYNDDEEVAKNAEGLSAIEAFSRSIATRPSGQPVLDPIAEEELTSMMMEHYSRIGNQSQICTDGGQEDSMQIHDESLPEPDYTGTPHHPAVHIFEDEDAAEPLEMKTRSMASPARRGIALRKSTETLRVPLSNTDGNMKKRKSVSEKPSPRKRRSLSPDDHLDGYANRTADIDGNTVSITSNISTDPLHLDTLTNSFSDDEDDVFLAEAVNGSSTLSKIPKMTIAQKLAAAEADATEATEVIRQRQATTYGKDDRRAKDRLKTEKKTVAKSVVTLRDVSKPLKKAPHSKAQKARDRRRSTLTPAELGVLMGQ